MDLQVLTTWFGWMLLISVVILTLNALGLIFMRQLALNTHKKLFDLNDEELNRLYFQYLTNFKLLVTVFFLVPYVALKLMA